MDRSTFFKGSSQDLGTNRSITSTLGKNLQSGYILMNSCRTLSMVICHCESSTLEARLLDDYVQVTAKTVESKYKKHILHALAVIIPASSARWSSLAGPHKEGINEYE